MLSHRDTYLYNKKQYKRKGRNHKIYFNGKLHKLKNISEQDLEYLLKRERDIHTTINRTGGFADVFLANIEILEDYIPNRRFEKIIHLKKNIKKQNSIFTKIIKLFKL